MTQVQSELCFLHSLLYESHTFAFWTPPTLTQKSAQELISPQTTFSNHFGAQTNPDKKVSAKVSAKVNAKVTRK